ncbi:MAG: hypothetical protein K2L95_02355 [Alphaproteobacteria bacterium]|nr:hypothetical protein [Alphaproteobacteria bacterium]
MPILHFRCGAHMVPLLQSGDMVPKLMPLSHVAPNEMPSLSVMAIWPDGHTAAHAWDDNIRKKNNVRRI